MKIFLTSIFVDDQTKSMQFYCDVLGFKVKQNVDMGKYKWLTLVSPSEPNGTELLLEPSDHPAVAPYRAALLAEKIPAHSFQVQDLAKEHARLVKLKVKFTMPPTNTGKAKIAVLDDTCGNLIQLIEMNESAT